METYAPSNDGVAFEIRLDVRGGDSFSRLGFMVHEKGVRKDHAPIRVCIVNDLHIQPFAQIFGKIRLILLHIGKPQALIGIWEANVSEGAIAIPGNDLPCLGFHDIYICLFWIFAPASLKLIQPLPPSLKVLERSTPVAASSCFQPFK